MTKSAKLLLVTQIITAAGLLFPTQAELQTAIDNAGSGADLTALTGRVTTNETDITTLTTGLAGAILTANTENGTLDTTLRALIESTAAQLGSRVGSSTTFAGLPIVDQNNSVINAGDTATLSATDGVNPAGLYEYDGTNYVLQIDYDAIDLTSIIANSTATQAEVDAGVINDKFVTPATLDEALTQAEVNTAAGA